MFILRPDCPFPEFSLKLPLLDSSLKTTVTFWSPGRRTPQSHRRGRKTSQQHRLRSRFRSDLSELQLTQVAAAFEVLPVAGQDCTRQVRYRSRVAVLREAVKGLGLRAQNFVQSLCVRHRRSDAIVPAINVTYVRSFDRPCTRRTLSAGASVRAPFV